MTSYPVSTQNQNANKVTTRKASNETNADWFERHFQNVLGDHEGSVFPWTDELLTCWYYMDGSTVEAHCKSSVRQQGETDDDFFNRHVGEVATDAATYVPYAGP